MPFTSSVVTRAQANSGLKQTRLSLRSTRAAWAWYVSTTAENICVSPPSA
jgi:hypothetical protein